MHIQIQIIHKYMYTGLILEYIYYINTLYTMFTQCKYIPCTQILIMHTYMYTSFSNS